MAELPDEQTIVETAKELMLHPLARRYVLNCLSNKGRVRTPEDVLGEQIFRTAGQVLNETLSPGRAALGLQREGESRLHALGRFMAAGLQAAPYLWVWEAWTQLRGLEIPRCVLSPKMLPAPNSWHTLQNALYDDGGEVEFAGRTYTDTAIDVLLVADHQRGFSVGVVGEWNDVTDNSRVPAIWGMNFKYGAVYPDDFPEDAETGGLLQTVLMMFSFLNSPYIPKERQRLGRGARRECARLGVPVDEEEVTFVVLRRPIGRKHEPAEPTAVEWKHQWIVNGHVRAQWYPSEQAHRLIWIAPYLKGPPDAPMLEHAYKVAR